MLNAVLFTHVWLNIHSQQDKDDDFPTKPYTEINDSPLSTTYQYNQVD